MALVYSYVSSLFSFFFSWATPCDDQELVLSLCSSISWESSGDHMWCWGSSPSQLCSKSPSNSLYYISIFISSFEGESKVIDARCLLFVVFVLVYRSHIAVFRGYSRVPYLGFLPEVLRTIFSLCL